MKRSFFRVIRGAATGISALHLACSRSCIRVMAKAFSGLGLSLLLAACVSSTPPTTADGSGYRAKPATSHSIDNHSVIAAAQDRRGVTWKLVQEPSADYTLYSLWEEVPGRPARRVAGPDSSFYWMLEEKIADRQAARELATQEVRRAIAESGHRAMQEIILQKSAMYAIQRDTYRALGFTLPKDFGLLTRDQDQR